MSLAAREVLGRAMPRPRVHDGNERLVAALCRGDADAFATLVDRHSPAMIRVAMAYVPSRAAAEEAVQETWIAVMRGIERFEGRSSLKTWIFRILTNVARAPAPASGGACRSRRSPRRRTPVSRRSTPIASCRPTTSSSPVTGRSCRRAGRRPFNRLQPAVGDTDAARDQRVERGVDLSEALRSRIRLLQRPGGTPGPASDIHPLTPNGADAASLPLGCRCENIHPDDQPLLEAIAVVNPGVRDQLAVTGVADHLMNLDRDGAVGLLGEALGLDGARDGGELPGPVVADCRAADHPPALPGVGPIHVRVHQLERGLDVARVERPVGGPQDLLSIRHATKLALSRPRPARERRRPRFS